jgi:hypothetical protein
VIGDGRRQRRGDGVRSGLRAVGHAHQVDFGYVLSLLDAVVVTGGVLAMLASRGLFAFGLLRKGTER